jgi:hypothetical protein
MSPDKEVFVLLAGDSDDVQIEEFCRALGWTPEMGDAKEITREKAGPADEPRDDRGRWAADGTRIMGAGNLHGGTAVHSHVDPEAQQQVTAIKRWQELARQQTPEGDYRFPDVPSHNSTRMEMALHEAEKRAVWSHQHSDVMSPHSAERPRPPEPKPSRLHARDFPADQGHGSFTDHGHNRDDGSHYSHYHSFEPGGHPTDRSHPLGHKAGPEDEARDDHGKWTAGGPHSASDWSAMQSRYATPMTENEKRDAYYLYDAQDEINIHGASNARSITGEADAQVYANELLSKYGTPETKVQISIVGSDNAVGNTAPQPIPDTYQIEIAKSWLSQAVIVHEMAHVIAAEHVGVVGHGQSFRDTYVTMLRGEEPKLGQRLARALKKEPEASTA